MKEKNDKQAPRPPVVVIMGHIDHGKSTLLDYIRKTNVTEKEEGGITQHIRAYEAEVDSGGEKRKITFLDTPGHEAFCSIRERGARIADIAVLIVSAEDGVKPQTIEALKCIATDATPYIVAINKIDKPGANIDKVKQSLAENEVFVEGWGGNIPFTAISAKTGENVPELLELILLQSDIENFKGDHSLPAQGFVVESSMNPNTGASATLLIKNGTLQKSSFVATHGAYAPVRKIENFKGENISEATFSSPVKITGWNNIPVVGKEFKAFKSKEDALKFANYKESETISKNQENEVEGKAFLTLVIKADASGSLEAIEHELQKLGSEKIGIKIVSKGIGSITEKDIKTASIKKSLAIGFNVGADKSAEALALRDNSPIKIFGVIYELLDYIKEQLEEATPITSEEVIVGTAKVLKTFSKNKDKQVIGGKMEEGEIKYGNAVKIFRREVHIGDGRVKEVQTRKIKTGSVKEGDEFGMMVESKMEIAEGDILKAVEMVKQK